jgi:hypothetical protein
VRTVNVNEISAIVSAMVSDPVYQYVTPGLTSFLVGAEGRGRVRLFVSDRDTREWITPHSHRFDFACLVLKGEVQNILFEKSPVPWGNDYALGRLRPVEGGMGRYEIERPEEWANYVEKTTVYGPGNSYSMNRDQIHSIRFGKGTKVLFFEGPNVVEESVFLEPWSNGKRVETFNVAPWMFQK